MELAIMKLWSSAFVRFWVQLLSEITDAQTIPTALLHWNRWYNWNRWSEPAQLSRAPYGMNLTYSIDNFHLIKFVLFNSRYVTSNIITFPAQGIKVGWMFCFLWRETMQQVIALLHYESSLLELTNKVWFLRYFT